MLTDRGAAEYLGSRTQSVVGTNAFLRRGGALDPRGDSRWLTEATLVGGGGGVLRGLCLHDT